MTTYGRDAGRTVKELSTFTAVDSWYDTDEFQTGGDTNILRVWARCDTADCGNTYFRVWAKDGSDGDYYLVSTGSVAASLSLSVGDYKAVSIPCISLVPRDYVKVQYWCSSNAGSAELEIKATAYGGNTPDFVPAIDKATGATITVPYEHHEIHGGSHYFVKTWVDIAGSGTVAYFGFQVPDTTVVPHAKAILFGEAEFTVEIYEGATYSAIGTPMTAINNDRNSTKTPGLTPYASPTITADNFLIWAGKIGSGRGSTGVSIGLGYEILAKRNTFYAFKLTKETSGTHYVDVDFFWYEHIDRSVLF